MNERKIRSPSLTHGIRTIGEGHQHPEGDVEMRNILVNSILKLWRLCPLSDITRCATKDTEMYVSACDTDDKNKQTVS